MSADESIPLISSLRSPGCSLVLAAALIMDTLILLGSHNLGMHCWSPMRIPFGYADGRAVLLPDDPGLADGGRVAQAGHWYTRRGFWAETTLVINHTLIFEPGSGRPPTDEEMADLRGQLADWLGQGSDPQLAALIRAGNGVTTRPIWSGYLANAVSLALAAGFLCSLGWMRDRARETQRSLAAAAGRCPGCNYELRGLTMVICPECGESLTPAAIAAAEAARIGADAH